ncbi:ABC transporter ATP-binding protein [Paenibacillus sp. NFR01]|uniref:ABC transporter ATP-binding protein n=1 Tax=Paenibacillus sp. NFR01 TaxID=1566279 RepID=UPI0008CCB821|nr:ABC transporter ATP-binding protein [Paenibacillus sp. NFR01]SEU29511.1 ATP-binding cassette, subfamily B, AbcA/BmrA [Paenibacillus sp. NFR01]
MDIKQRRLSAILGGLLKLARPYWGWYAVLCALAAVSSFTTVGVAETLRRIINAATDRDSSALASNIGFAVVIVIIDALANFCSVYLAGVLEFKSTARLQVSLLGRLLNVRMKDLDRYHSADLISRVDDSVPVAQQGINQRLVELVGNVMQIVFLFTYLLSLQGFLTLGTLVICLLIPFIMLPFNAKMRGYYIRRQQVETAQQQLIQDTVQGAEVVRAFSLAPKLQGQFTERVKQYLNIHIPLTRIEAVGFNMNFTVILGGILYILGYGGYLVIHGRLDVGAIAAFLIVTEQITNPASRLAMLWTTLQTSLAQGSRLFEVMDLPEERSGAAAEPVQPDDVEAAVGGAMPISLEGVSFGYGEERVLRGVNLTIEPAKVTAFAGPSGGGKSTLLQLLLTSYEPDEGIIRAGGVPLSSIPLKSWRSQIAYVSQEPYLFSGSLYDNILWGAPGASRDEVVRSAQLAGIHDFIMRTPQQYETLIGERGLTLSGGERQRLSIARAFIREPKLLLLDEPTAALDSHNEEIVQHALGELMKGRTTVVIAHRLSTIQNADRIFFLEAGRIAEQGTHQQLMELQGKYYAMVEASLSGSRAAVSSGG